VDRATQTRIHSDPDIMGGKPVVRGTRITVEHILRKLGEGMSIEQVLAEHPRLSLEDIHAAERFAADYLGNEEIAFG